MNPNVSILIPVYQATDYIEKCALSLFNQTFEDIEYIFVNDGTPDDSIEKLLKVIEQFPYRKDRIKILHHPENRGSGASKNTALDASTGDYISFVDSDDYIEPDMIESLYKKAVEENADIVISDLFMEFQDKSVIMTDNLSNNEEDHFSGIIRNIESHTFLCNKLVRRDLYLRQDCRIPEGLNYYEDRHVMTRIFYYADKIVKINRPFYHYIHYNTLSITKTKNRMHFQNVVQFWSLLDSFLKEHNKYDINLTIIEFSKIQNKVSLLIDTHSSKLRKEYANMFREEETHCLNCFKRGEKLMLLLVRHRLFCLAQLFHNYLVMTNKK